MDSLQEGFTNLVRACSPSTRRKSEPANASRAVEHKKYRKHHKAKNMDDPFELGQMVSGDILGNDLHEAATKGNTKQLKGVLKRGIFVDYPNDKGQTPLFCACYANQERAAEILLKAGANPNEKTNDGTTPVHATCYNGNINLLVLLIKAGGDLRLHDKDGKTATHWADLQPDSIKRFKMMEFLEKSHLFAMTHSGGDSQQQLCAEATMERKRSILEIIRKKVEKVPSMTFDPLRRVNSTGFGCVYVGNDDHGAIVSTIPLVSESHLHHDPQGITYQNGAFLVMESMTWNHSAVTVKRLQQETQPGAYIDLLISEMGNMGKIRHQNILLLMGVCQTNSLDNMVLVFERVGLGSLYYYLHQRLERLPTQNVRDILQQICSAIVFIHHQNFIHCGLSSHAVNLVNPYLAKVGNLEYMIESTKADMGRQSMVSTNMAQNSLYNWMAPELMIDQPPSQASDVYSYSCIIWEMFECAVPWDMCDAEYIKNKLTKEHITLNMENSKIPQPFKSIAEHGLRLDTRKRDINIDQINHWVFSSSNQVITPDKQLDVPPKPKRLTSSVSPEDVMVGTQSAPSTASNQSSKSSSSKKAEVANMNTTANSKPSSAKSPVMKSQKQRYGTRASPASSPTKTQRKPYDMTKNSPKPGRKQLNENHNYGPLDMNTQWMMNYPSHYSSTESYSQDSGSEDYYLGKYSYSPPKSGYKFTRFCTDKSDWTCEIKHKQEGDRFGYAAEIRKVVKTDSKVKKDMYAEVEGIMKRETELQESRQGSHHGSCQTSPSPADKIRMFSYMSLNRETGDRTRCVCKPATHCVEPSPPKSNSLKLSSAGSLYALYNSGSNQEEILRKHLSPSLPEISKKMHESLFSKAVDDVDDSSEDEETELKGFCEQQQLQQHKQLQEYKQLQEQQQHEQQLLEQQQHEQQLLEQQQQQNKQQLQQQKQLQEQQQQQLLEQQKQQQKQHEQQQQKQLKQWSKSDPTWYGGKGSVKNLVNVYQEQVEDHIYQQSVLRGALAPFPSKQNDSGDQRETFLSSEKELKECEEHTNTFVEGQPKELEFPYYLPASFACSVDDDSDMPCQTESDVFEEVSDISPDAQSEGPDLTIVTNTTATPISSSDSVCESGMSVDSVLLDTWIHKQLETVQRELSKEQTEKMSFETLKKFYHLGGHCEEPAKETIKTPEVSKKVKRQNQNTGFEEENCDCKDTQSATQPRCKENTQKGTKIADHLYKHSARESDGSLLKEVMEELSRTQVKRKAQQRIQRNEFDLQEYYIDDDIEKHGLKLDGPRQHWAVPRAPASESGMSNRSEKSTSTKGILQYPQRTHEVSSCRDRVVTNVCPKPEVCPKSSVAYVHSERRPKKKSKGYMTTVTVTSSVDRPGKHKLKHTATNLSTGEIKTLHEQMVHARSVISTINPR